MVLSGDCPSDHALKPSLPLSPSANRRTPPWWCSPCIWKIPSATVASCARATRWRVSSSRRTQRLRRRPSRMQRRLLLLRCPCSFRCAFPHFQRQRAGRYYLTDVLAFAATTAVMLALVTEDAEEAMGVNSRIQLASRQGHAASHQPASYGGGRHHVGPRYRMDRPRCGNRKTTSAFAHDVSDGKDFRRSRYVIGPNTRLTDVGLGMPY